MSERSKRMSNIELLRIAAACGVIVLHYNAAKIGKGFAYAPDGSATQFFMALTESAAICAVDLFVLISGYFMRNSMKRDLIKPVNLLMQLAVFETGFYLIKELPKGKGFSAKTFAGYFTGMYWFVFVYIALYLISPYINVIWQKLEDKGKRTLLIVMLGLFSVWPTLTEMLEHFAGTHMRGITTVGIDGAQNGYTIVNFVLMYLIGCKLRDLDDKGKQFRTSRLALLLCLNIALITGWAYIEKKLSGSELWYTTGWYYQNPLVICEAVLFFLLFRSFKIRHNRVINRLAAASFPVYLIHANLLSWCRIKEYTAKGAAVTALHLLICIVLIYLISFAVSTVYDFTIGRLPGLIARHWHRGRTYTVDPK